MKLEVERRDGNCDCIILETTNWDKLRIIDKKGITKMKIENCDNGLMVH